MELTKKDTKMLQGLSALSMMCLHLFCREYHGLYTPVVFWDGVPLSFYFAQLSDFCVFGFAFCSGYGHAMQADFPEFYKHRVKGVLLLLYNYWIIILVFSVVSLIAGDSEQMPGNASTFVLNMLTLDNSYNGAWWYMFTYIVIVFISPFLMKMVKKFHPVSVMGMAFIIYCVAYYVRFSLGEIDLSKDILNAVVNWILLKFGPFGMTLFEYLVGAECCKLHLFTKVYSIWKKPNVVIRTIAAAILFVVMLYGRTKIVSSLFIAPITGFIIMMLFHFWRKPQIVQLLFGFIGKQSTNIWLTHMFFYSKIFVNFVYIMKYPLFIYGLMLFIVIWVSIILNIIVKTVTKLIK